MKLVAAGLMLLTLGALGEVVVNFNTCAGSFRNGTSPSMITNGGRYIKICQKHKNQYRYATLYDTEERIPVYSAYQYKKTVDCIVPRPDITWMIEPQIDNLNAVAEMALQGKNPKSGRQAYNSDYEGSRYDKGHLYPHCHAPDGETSESTFTLTNAAPQRCDFNKFWYDKVEVRVKNVLSNCLTTGRTSHVVTGVVPSIGTERLTLKNNPVNVPTHFWTACCCCVNNNQCQFEGFIMHREADDPEGFPSIQKFNTKLTTLYGKGFTVFSSC